MAAALAVIVPLFCGCQAWYSVVDHDTRRFAWADASADASKEAAKEVPKLLGWSGGSLEPFRVPGLTQEEVTKYVDSGRIKTEAFHYYHGELHIRGSRDDYRMRAKLSYTERFNRALLDLILMSEKGHNQQPQETSGQASPAAPSQSSGAPPLQPPGH